MLFVSQLTATSEVEEVDVEKIPRTFRFSIDSIVIETESKTEYVFVEFEFGGESIEDEVEDTIEKITKKKFKKPDGTVEEIEVTEQVNLKQVRVKSAPTAKYFTYMKRQVKAKESEKYTFDRVEGEWIGCYALLKKEFLTIRVWTANIASCNVLLGTAKESFIDVADGKVDRSVNVKKNSKSARDETVCSLKFKFELQEFFDFDIKLQVRRYGYILSHIHTYVHKYIISQ